MFGVGQQFFKSGAIASQFVGDDHPRLGMVAKQFSQETLGCTLIALFGHQDVEGVARLIDCPPQIVPFTADA